MPRPNRARPAQRGGPPAGGGIREDIRALNSSILLITQKMKYLVRNEKILGRNLIVLNKKIKGLEVKVAEGKESEEGEGASSEAVLKLQERIESLESDNSDMRSRLATKEDLQEVKFVIDSINPLEFASLAQVRELIDKRVDELKRREIENSVSSPPPTPRPAAPAQPAAQSAAKPTQPSAPVSKPSDAQNDDGSIK